MRLSHFSYLGLALTLVAASPASAQDNAVSSAEALAQTQTPIAIPKLALPPYDRSTENYQLALQIVQISLPEGQFEALMRREFPIVFESALLSTPEFEAMEYEYPGLTKLMSDRFTDFFVARVMANREFFVDANARQFAEGLTLEELREYLAFLKRPIGLKLLSGAYDFIQFDPTLVNKAIKTDSDADWDRIVTADMSKANKLANELSPEELDELFAFVNSPLARKLKKLNSVSNQGAMEVGFEQLMDEESLEQLFENVFEEYFANQANQD